MNLVLATAVAALFACGTFLLLKADLLRIIVGILLISNSATLALMAAGLTRGQPPIEPLEDGVPVSDPLVQALALTAIVIAFATIAVLLAIGYRIHRLSDTLRLDELARREAAASEELEHEEPST